MSQTQESMMKWMSGRRKLYRMESLLFGASLIFLLASIVCAVFIFYQYQARHFQQVSPLEPYVLIFLIAVSVTNAAALFTILYLRRHRHRLENKYHCEDFQPVYDEESFYEVLKREMRRAGRYHLSMSLCFVCLDEFETLCRRRGREYGNKTLDKFSELVIGIIRASDYFSHLGGNEFAIILCHTDLLNAESFLYRLLLNTQERMDLSFSAGLTTYRVGENPGDFIRRSRQALKQARQEGSRRIHCAIGKDDSQVIKTF